MANKGMTVIVKRGQNEN